MEEIKANTLERYLVVIATIYLVAFARQKYFWFKYLQFSSQITLFWWNAPVHQFLINL